MNNQLFTQEVLRQAIDAVNAQHAKAIESVYEAFAARGILPDCCAAWTLSGEADTEDAGGHLRTKDFDGKGWIMGIRLPRINFCPWCGAKK